jgi:rhodanese-related sulfurtransferase
MKPMRYLFLFITLLTFTAFGQSKEYRSMLKKYYSADFPTISIADAKAKIGKPNVYFLDTREKEEFNVSHIKTAMQVGYDNFDISSVSKLPKDAEIIVYCSIGARSQTIGQKLIKAGYTNVKNLYGGLFHWANNSYPMRDPSGEKTTKIHGFSTDWGKWIYRGTVVY